MVEGFNTLASARVLNLPDKRVDPDCWLMSGFESPRRQFGFKPLSGSHQLRTLHCRATLICASFGGLIIYYHIPTTMFRILSIMTTVFKLPSSPVHPEVQLQVYPPRLLTHAPFGSQAVTPAQLSRVSHVNPCQPSAQTQVYALI